MAETVLVIGATGTLGAPVARRFLQDGFGVRALTRDGVRARQLLGAGVEVSEGDVTDAASLSRALEGVQGIHISLQAAPQQEEAVEHQGTARVAEMAVQKGVTRLSFVSGMYVGLPEATSPAELAKTRAEAAIKASGVPYVIFRPSYFMETLPRHIQGKRAVVIGEQLHPLHMIAAEDFAKQVVIAFRTPEAVNQTFYVQGPEAHTIKDALHLYCQLVHPDKRVVQMPIALMSVINRLFMKGQLSRTLQLMRLMQRRGEVGNSALTDKLLWQPTTTLQEWGETQRSQQGEIL